MHSLDWFLKHQCESDEKWRIHRHQLCLFVLLHDDIEGENLNIPVFFSQGQHHVFLYLWGGNPVRGRFISVTPFLKI